MATKTRKKTTAKRPRAVSKRPAAKRSATGVKRASARKTAPPRKKKAAAKRAPAARKSPTSPRARKESVASLAEYNAKRDFQRTAEPAGRTKRSPRQHKLEFVIQKHAASHLHFDFRLELDGAMKSWAVPKGPHYDPSVRRLAMEVEDHPMEYNAFEGTIPKGEYGGGTVMIWDRGWYEPERAPRPGETAEDVLREGYLRGDLKFIMHGKRMRGGWVLVRMRREGAGKPQWLLIKHRDDEAREDYDVVAEKTTSVVSRRTMESIGRTDRVWRSNR